MSMAEDFYDPTDVVIVYTFITFCISATKQQYQYISWTLGKMTDYTDAILDDTYTS
jgi:hypothetical protein